ncbi:ATP-binding protein [Streptomyces sp. KLOTTS4A1]|uniref:ATP-binding protein n=1 Tax=Streptomyces sp. KLOTTS4A1 TaxID=3390996 RepID=UPI0039F60696
MLRHPLVGTGLALLAAGAVSLGAIAADQDWQPALAGGLAAAAVLLFAWVLLAARHLTAERAERERLARLLQARDAELAHLVSARLPAIRERVNAGRGLDGVPGALRTPEETGPEFAASLGTLVTALGSDEAVRRERVLRDSVQAAFESVARTMHAMATVQQQVLDQVERSIDHNPALMTDVMKADHAAAQMTRKAQTLLVMCGVWPARRETRPVSLYDCVRGAMSRIVEFSRVEVHGGQTLYAVPPAVEGLMHTLAELLENATVFSPSPSNVIVSVREVGAGAVIEIDDAGLGMPPDVLARATAQLRDDVDLARLGAVPRLGLACVGRWMRELGFDVQLSGASAYGGTRAVAFIPFRLLTEPLPPLPESRPEPEARTAADALAATSGSPATTGLVATARTSVPHRRADEVPSVDHPPVPQGATPAEGSGESAPSPQAPAPASAPASTTPTGLPRRRSRRAAGATTGSFRLPAPAPSGAPAPPAAGTAPAAPAAQPWTPEAAKASIASVLSGSRRGRSVTGQYDDAAPSADHGSRDGDHGHGHGHAPGTDHHRTPAPAPAPDHGPATGAPPPSRTPNSPDGGQP